MSAQVAESLNASPHLDRGVFHAERLFDPLEFFAAVEKHGIS